MQTQSDPSATGIVASEAGQWAPAKTAAARSLFANYAAIADSGSQLGTAQSGPAVTQVPGLQGSIDRAVARSFVYRVLAKIFEDPSCETWALLTNADSHQSFRLALEALAPDRRQVSVHSKSDEFTIPAARLLDALQPDAFQAHHSAYLSAFGHAARGGCPLNEIEYGELKADALFQPHRLADLAAFYRAFGLELGPEADERHDHLCIELEFMCVLAAKEAFALEHQLGAGEFETCRLAQKKFLREHLARWTPAFARRLAQVATSTPLAAAAAFLEEWITFECSAFGVVPGDHELALRPADEAAESLCASCTLNHLPPGAVAVS